MHIAKLLLCHWKALRPVRTQDPVADFFAAGVYNQVDLRLRQPECFPLVWRPVPVVWQPRLKRAQERTLSRVVLTNHQVDAFKKLDIASIAERLETLNSRFDQSHSAHRNRMPNGAL